MYIHIPRLDIPRHVTLVANSFAQLIARAAELQSVTPQAAKEYLD